jgi:hypothetical protein
MPVTTTESRFPARDAFSREVLKFYPKWRSLYEAVEAEAHAHCHTDEEIQDYLDGRHSDPLARHIVATFHRADLFPDVEAFPPSTPLGDCLAKDDPWQAVNEMVNALSWMVQQKAIGTLPKENLEKLGELLEAFALFLD